MATKYGKNGYYILDAGELVFELAARDRTPDVYGNAEANTITGNRRDNFLAGGGGNDTLVGGAGNDVLMGGDGVDSLSGGAHNDLYFVDDADDLVIELANEGIDHVLARTSFTLTANVEHLTLFGDGELNGTGNGLDNRIIGNASKNSLNGDDGDDTLDGGAGDDVLTGGKGNDVYILDAVTDFVVEEADGGIDTIITVVTDTIEDLVNVENLTLAGTFAIDGTGNSVANRMIGNGAINSLSGLGGDDVLDGGLGNDILTGGDGKDAFRLSTKLNKDTNVDKITDFVVADDSVQLDNAIFKKLGRGTESDPKVLRTSFFKVGEKAGDRNDYIVYNKDTGILYYDADGSGRKAAVAIADIGKNLDLTAANFYVI